MANNIIDISKQQRVVFIDNVTDDRAKTLSNEYKFGVFFGNGPAQQNSTEYANNNTGVIYKNGKRYSLVTAVSNQSIKLNTYNNVFNIKLQIDENGVLSLNVSNAISDFELVSYSDVNGTITPWTGNVIDIYETTYLYFRFKEENSDEWVYYPTSDLLTFIFDDESVLQYMQIPILSVEENNDGTTRYKFKAIKDSGELELPVKITVEGLEQSRTYRFKTHLLSGKIFYIGNISTFRNNQNYDIYDTDMNNNLNEAGWHSFNKDLYSNASSQDDIYKYYTIPHNTEYAGFDFSEIGINNFGIILPEDMSIYLPMTDEGNRVIDYIEDQYIDGSFEKTMQITINGEPYNVFQYINREDGLTRFINYIGYRHS